MIINRFEALNRDAKLIYLKLKGTVVEELILEDEIIKLYAVHDFLVAIMIRKGNFEIKEIYTIDTTEEKIWENICIDSLFV